VKNELYYYIEGM